MNVLTNSNKSLHITKNDFFKVNILISDNKYGKGAAVIISSVFERIKHMLVKGHCETALYRYLSNGLFRSR